jgi:hypothetical protein
MPRTITELTLKGEFYSLILQRVADGQISKEGGKSGGYGRKSWHGVLVPKSTVQNDKLIALSGVIRSIERSTG